MGQITANALAWAGLRSAGGPRKCFYLSIVYAAAVLGILFLSLASNPLQHDQILQVASRMLLGAQFLLLGICVGLTILNTIQRDRTSKMLESHRLMPIHPRLVVLGYIAGGEAPYGFAVLFNFVAGGMMAGASGLPMDWWVAANVVAITFCMFLWTIAAVAGFCGLIAGAAISLPLVIVLLSGGQAGMGIPSVLMLASPVLGATIFSGMPPISDQMLLWAISFIMQLGVGSVFVEMAARRFRHQDMPLLPAGRGLLLVGLLAGGAAIAANFAVRAFLRGSQFQMDTAATGTYILLLIVSAIVITSAAAAERFEHPRRAAKIADTRGLLLVLAIALIAAAFGALVDFTAVTQRTALMAALVHTAGPQDMALIGERVLWTVAVFVVCGVLVQLLAKWAFQVGAGNITLVWITSVISLGPPFLSMAFRDVYSGLTTAGQIILQISPFAMIVAIWSKDRSVEVQPLSLAILASLIAIPVLLLSRQKRSAMPAMLKA